MDNMLFISNLFPSGKNPEYGTFVKHNLDLLEKEYTIDKVVMKKVEKKYHKVINYIYFFSNIFSKLLSRNYDVIYVHYPSFSFIPIYIKLKFSKKILKNSKLVVNLHGSDLITNRMFNKLLNKIFTKKALENSDLIVVPSKYFQDVVCKYGIDQDKVFVSYSGGYDSQIFNLSKKLKPDKLTIAYCSRLVKSKGLSTLIDSIIHLKELGDIDITKIKLNIIGDGPEKLSEQRKVKENNLSNVINFCGFKSQEEISLIYKNSNVFVFPTQYESESLGLVGIEAMASGLLLIGSNHPALSTYLFNESNGYVFNQGSSEQLGDIISEIYKDCFVQSNHQKIDVLINNGLKTVGKFEKNVVGQKLLNKLRIITK